MAAFEHISTHTIQPQERSSFIDIRTVVLAAGHPDDGSTYDPRKGRVPKSPMKVSTAYFSLLRSMFGAGVMAMPLAISQAGMLTGPLITIIIMILLHHTHHMLVRMTMLALVQPIDRYGFRIALLHGPDILSPLGLIGPQIIATFMFLSQLGICSVFLVFVGDSLRDVFDVASTRMIMGVIFLPILALVFVMKKFKYIGYVSMLGNALMVLGLILTYYLILSDEPYNSFILSTDNIVLIMMAVGIILFNHSAIAVILTIDKALPDPYLLVKPFGILDIGMVLPALVGMVFGMLCYWEIGEMDQNVLRSLPVDDSLTVIVLVLYSIAVAFAYPLQCFPGIEIMLETYRAAIGGNVINYPRVIDYMMRLIFVSMTFLIIYLVPFQGPLVAFVGSLCTAQLTIVFPAMMDLSLMYPGPYGRRYFRLIKDLLIIVFGLCISVCGVILSGYLIYLRTLL